MSLKEKKLFLLDMDGTIYLDNELFDGTLDFLDYVKKSGGRYIFITNNSSKSVDAYVNKLKNLGICASSDDFLTSADATCLYLEKMNYKKIYIFGTESFVSQIEKFSLPYTTELEDDIDCLCMGYDTSLTYKKLEEACILLNRGVDYVATNPDWVCPTWYGFVPDCGSVAQMLYNATKRNPKFIGKPEPEMIYLAMEKAGAQKSETVVVGDRLYTDIASGKNAGVEAVFVLSGEGTEEDMLKSDVKPDYVCKDIREILNIIKNN